MIDFGVPYYSISLSLNVLLTLMIVIRLILHNRKFRNVTGGLAGTNGLYKAVVSMLVESCALYAVTFLLFIVPWASDDPVVNIFFPILAETQVIAPFLITLRVANQSTSGTVGSIHFGSRGRPIGGSGALPAVYPTSSMNGFGKTSGDQHGVGTVTTVDSYCDKV